MDFNNFPYRVDAYFDAVWMGVYKVFYPKPLWVRQEGLQKVIQDDGSIIPIEKDKDNDPPKLITPTTPQQKADFLYNTMSIKKSIVDLNGKVLVSDVSAVINKKVNLMLSNMDRYNAIARKFPNPIKGYHIALIHEMEANQDFSRYLGNGQPWNKKTTIVPIGRGPFKSFEEGAVDAIIYDKLDKVKEWTIGNTLYLLEGFNGYGYSLYRGINSPYLWSGSNHYTAGKYVSDGKYSATAVSNQIGIALLMKTLLSRI